ncbi:MAG: DUF4382 domain-containing protein [Bacteroidetes bacterium]|nr:DUF4382 domain-containing protein [Bacteroidota bacterium]
MKTKLISVLILLLGFMYGCSELFDDNEVGNNQEGGSVRISLTDAPFPFEEVAEANVVIDWIKLKKIGDETGDEDGDSLFITLLVEDTFNLLDLSNGVKTILGELDSVPAGEYDQIRMHVVEASIKLNDDSNTEYNLKIPSGGSSGLKIMIKPALIVEEGEESEILLDFDASRSFKMKGNMNGNNGNSNGNGNGNSKGITGFMFKPVIRAVNLALTTEIYGVVKDTFGVEIDKARLFLTVGADTIASAKTSEDGYYKIMGVAEGNYDLICGKQGYVSDTTEILDVKKGDIIERNFALTPIEN